jgi:microcystin-dependent protein
MSDPFLAEIKVVSFSFAPKGWALCNGQLLQIAQNQALFSLLGTTYGGNGTTTFALPDFRSRSPMHVGRGHVQGERAGEEAHTLIVSEIPTHTHTVQASDARANLDDPTGTFWASPASGTNYASSPSVNMLPAAISTVGGSLPHNNMQPYLTLNFIIAIVGIYPSRD